MSSESVNPMQKQFESTIGAPVRRYASLMLDHLEQLADVQFEAARAYAETGARQARASLDVQDPSDVRTYVENQQKLARELGERLKDDAERAVSLHQDFAQKVQQVIRTSAGNVSAAAGRGK